MMGHLVYPKGAALIVAASLPPATACCGRHSADEFYGVPPDRFSIGSRGPRSSTT